MFGTILSDLPHGTTFTGKTFNATVKNNLGKKNTSLSKANTVQDTAYVAV